MDKKRSWTEDEDPARLLGEVISGHQLTLIKAVLQSGEFLILPRKFPMKCHFGGILSHYDPDLLKTSSVASSVASEKTSAFERAFEFDNLSLQENSRCSDYIEGELIFT